MPPNRGSNETEELTSTNGHEEGVTKKRRQAGFKTVQFECRPSMLTFVLMPAAFNDSDLSELSGMGRPD